MVVAIVGFLIAVTVIAAVISGIEIYQKIRRLNEAKKVLKSTLKSYLDNVRGSGRCTVIKFDDLDKM